jgi:cation:H+ antiporter
MLADFGSIALGLVLLVIGGELLVRGSVQAAERLGVSPLLIGLTLVGFGTSTPELVTSVQASLIGAPGIAYGNIVGSNIANILLILGLAALIFPVGVASSALQRDGTIVIATAMLFAFVGYTTDMNRFVGAAFVALLLYYVYSAYRQEQIAGPGDHGAAYDRAQCVEGTVPHQHEKAEDRKGGILVPILIALAGLAVVVVGGRFLVDGAVALARDAGLSETVIGLTIVAVGTSLPELVTSVIAAIRRQSDLALGNILGSNIYNVLGIGGLTALIAPSAMPAQIVTFDNLVMIGVSVLLFIVAFTANRITRWEGALLVAGYAFYVWWIWPR